MDDLEVIRFVAMDNIAARRIAREGRGSKRINGEKGDLPEASRRIEKKDVWADFSKLRLA
jgi:hypothetical protein